MALSLQKGQKISLTKPGAAGLTKVFMGLGWDVASPKTDARGKSAESTSIDLDASCLLFDDKRQLVDTVWFRQLASKDGSVKHSGDNRTGAGDGDDEVIHVDLSAVPANVSHLVFTVNSFTGQDFSRVANAVSRLVDATSKVELARFSLAERGSHTGLIMTKLYRHSGEWKMQAIGEVGTGRTFTELLPKIADYL